MAGAHGFDRRCAGQGQRAKRAHSTEYAHDGRPAVTKGGLSCLHGTLDYYIRALNKDTGEEVWHGRLPVGGQGAPISYAGRNGKRHTVVTVCPFVIQSLRERCMVWGCVKIDR